jgi:hypothetical protein
VDFVSIQAAWPTEQSSGRLTVAADLVVVPFISVICGSSLHVSCSLCEVNT